MMMSGFLDPRGRWEPILYSEHETWAEQECETEGLLYHTSACNVLIENGYCHISDGNAFLVKRDMSMVKLNTKQLDWLLEHMDELTRGTRRTLVDSYGLVIPGVEATDYSVPLAEPYSTGG